MSRSLVSVSSAALVLSGISLLIPQDGWAQMEEIVVTTRKKEESLQELPIAVDTIGAEQLQRQGITNVVDITRLSPSVQFDQSFGPSDNRIAIRGLSNTRGRSNVAFLVDGIDVTTENLISAGSGLLANQRLLNDVERVEIVKGPQSALYGRAAFAGAISYVTKEPSAEFESKLRLDLAEYGYSQIDGSIGGPVAGLEDKLGIRASGVYWNRDGAFTNSVSGDHVGGGNGWGGSLTGVFTPSDPIKIKGRVEYSRDQLDPQPVVRVGGGTQGANMQLLEYPIDAITADCDRVLNDPTSPQSQKDQCMSGSAPQIDFAACNALPDGQAKTDCLNGVTPSVDPTGQGRLIDPNMPASPANTLNPTVVLPPFGYGSDQSTGLLDFNQYCPDHLKDPSRGPGYCLPTTFGNTSDHGPITQSENPFTGEDNFGTETELLRISLRADMDMDYGTFTSLTGWTDYAIGEQFDQDYQAEGRPDLLLQDMHAETDGRTKQFSQELRFQSNFDEGPWQFSLGGFYWEEDRSLTDRNYIISCTSHTVDKLAPPGTPARFPAVSGLCDGTANNVQGLPTITTWQEMALALPPCQYDSNNVPVPSVPGNSAGCQQEQRQGAPWQADTEHWSLYTSVDFDLAENWTLTFEDRFVYETFDLMRPNFSSCANLALPINNGLIVGLPAEPNPVNTAAEDVRCTSASRLNPAFAGLTDFDVLTAQNWALIEGTTTSKFHTPKLLLRALPTDSTMVYMHWARAQKPGGINQLAAGGAPTTIDNERFDSEKMEAWEIGAKTDWNAGGFLQVNGAFFFNDYTDKQVGTQVVREVGGIVTLQPRVVNAAAAESWGAELEATWQPQWVEGLTLTASYTYLDATYTDFKDDTRSLVRAAMAGGNSEVVYVGEGDIDVDPNTLYVYPSADTDNLPAGTETFDAQPFNRMDLSGNKLERSPENAFVGQVNYTAQVGDEGFDWFVGMQASFEDERFVDADNYIKFDPYWLVNTQLGLTGEKWEWLIYVDNLLEDDTIRTGGTGPDFGPQVDELGFTAGLGVSHWFGILPQPRVVGMRLSMNF
jgi:outer membrane receptor protein involved in Fe transport